MARRKSVLFNAFPTLFAIFAMAVAPSAQAQSFTQQTDPKPILYTLIQAFQNCGPPQAYQLLGVQLYQYISMQTGGSGCYVPIRDAGPVAGMEVTGVQNFPAGPVFSVRVSHQGGTTADWFIGLSNFTGRVEYLNYQAAQSNTPITPQTLPNHRSDGGDNIPNPPPKTPTKGCEMFPTMCSP
jgi:hypothetical protein